MSVIRNSNFIFTVLCFEQSVFEFEVTNSRIRNCILEVGDWTKTVAVTFNTSVGDDLPHHPQLFIILVYCHLFERVSDR